MGDSLWWPRMGAAEREGKEVKLDIIQNFCRKTTFFFPQCCLQWLLSQGIYSEWSHETFLWVILRIILKTSVKKKEKTMIAWSTWDLFCMRWRTLAKLSTNLKNLSINEIIVATKSYCGMTQYMKTNPTEWSFIHFIMTGSSNCSTAIHCLQRKNNILLRHWSHIWFSHVSDPDSIPV